jgi:hypothetical protein
MSSHPKVFLRMRHSTNLKDHSRQGHFLPSPISRTRKLRNTVRTHLETVSQTRLRFHPTMGFVLDEVFG